MTESESGILRETVIISKYFFPVGKRLRSYFHALAGERPSKVVWFSPYRGGSRVLCNKGLPVGAQVFMGH